MSRLTPFRLTDVPLELRLRAVRHIQRATIESIPDTKHAEDRLFARLHSPAEGDRDALRRIAERPSPKVYWISLAAYERVMHPKNRRTC